MPEKEAKLILEVAQAIKSQISNRNILRETRSKVY